MNWSRDDLNKFAETDDLHIAPFREDGKTTGTPTWIWSVVVDNNLYVRAYYGQDSRWYQAAIREKAGQITAIGKTMDVYFETVDESMNESIDSAYRKKYADSPYMAHMIGPKAQSATIKILPRGKD